MTTSDFALCCSSVNQHFEDKIPFFVSNEDKAYALYQAAKDILKKDGFNLKKFCSITVLLQMMINRQEKPELQSASVDSELTEENETYTSVTLRSSNDQHMEERRILEVWWDVVSNEFVVSLEEVCNSFQHNQNITGNNIEKL